MSMASGSVRVLCPLDGREGMKGVHDMSKTPKHEAPSSETARGSARYVGRHRAPVAVWLPRWIKAAS